MTDIDPAELSETERSALRQVAQTAVRRGLDTRRDDPPDYDGVPPSLMLPGATFVTLRRRGQLLGCIGTIEPRRPLVDDVAHNAWGAAFADPRLPAVTADDLAELEVKISVLGPLEPIEVTTPEALRAILRPGIDGLLIEAGPRRATFLPSVWEQVPTADEFLDLLWRKAGMNPGRWPDDLQVSRYSTLEF